MADSKTELAELRDKIAQIDQEIVSQLDARARLSKSVQALLEGHPVSADGTERQWLERIEAAGSGDMPVESLRAIFRRVGAESRAIEEPVRVAYLGPEGGFCHEMARSYFGTTGVFTECITVSKALDEVERGRAVFAVFPFESSDEGLLHPSVTALSHTELVLVAERVMTGNYDLKNRTGNLDDIEKIYATATAHAVCERFLDQHLSRAAVIDVRSPVVAVQMAMENHGSAAIVPEPCQYASELAIARANVGATPESRLRFGVAAQRPAIRSGSDRTSLLFSVDETAGALFEVLRHFAERGIHLKKLQSRPVQSQSWEYMFYVEVGGHVTDRPVVTALEAVKQHTSYLKVLGSYPSQN